MRKHPGLALSALVLAMSGTALAQDPLAQEESQQSSPDFQQPGDVQPEQNEPDALLDGQLGERNLEREAPHLGDTEASSEDQGEESALAQSEQSVLQRFALSEPDKLNDKAIRNSEGEKIAELREVAIKSADSTYHARVETEKDGKDGVVSLSELEIDSLLFEGGREALSEQEYEESEYSSLAATDINQLGAAEEVGANDQGALADAAREQPEQFSGIAIRDPEGETLGELDEVVRKTEDGSLHAVVSLAEGEDSKAIISLEELEIDALRYGENEDQLAETSYDEDEYIPMSPA